MRSVHSVPAGGCAPRTALAYLRNHGLSAEAMPDGKLSIGPVANITQDIRCWIREHRHDVLAELALEADENAREYFAERAAITEYDGELSREDAEQQAAGRVWEYRLAGVDQWLTLIGQPGDDETVIWRWCRERFGARVLDVRPYLIPR